MMRFSVGTYRGVAATVLLIGQRVLASPSIFTQIALLEDSNSTLLQYPSHFTQNIVVSAPFLILTEGTALINAALAEAYPFTQ